MDNVVDGQKIGKYQVLQMIGSGGMGHVYLAYDFQLERNVAIKCLRKDLEQTDCLGRLKREAKILAKLNHTHIVQLYDLVEDGDQFAIVMEYVRGCCLTDYLKTCHYSLEQALEWLLQIARGIQAAHDQGIIHRDLKADNILINETGEVKITDFGIARKFSDTHTSYGKIVGSYSALAPEQALGQPLDHRSDLFALGIMAYRLFCGKHPFGDYDNPAELIKKLLYDEFVPPERYNVLPFELNQLISQLLSKKADDRPVSASVVIKKIESICESNECREIIDRQQIEFTHTVDRGAVLNEGAGSDMVPHNLGTILRRVRYKRFWGVFGLAILFFLFFVFYKSILGLIEFSTGKQPDVFVRVLDPEVSDNDTSQLDETSFLAISLLNATEQAVIGMPGIFLAENISEVNPAEDTALVVKTKVQCEKNKCEAKLSLVKAGKIVNQLRWSFLKYDSLAIYQLTQSKVYKLLGRVEADRNSVSISHEDLKLYLLIAKEFRDDPVYDPIKLANLKALISREPRFEASYRVYREYLLNAFTETNNEMYLEDLSQMLDFAKIHLSSSLSLQYNLLELNFAKQDPDKIRLIIQRLRELGDAQFNILFAEARLASLENDYDLAIKYYLDALSLQRTVGTLRNLAELYWLSGNSDLAKIRLQELDELSPDDYHGRFLSATIALTEGRIPDAINIYTSLLSTHKESQLYSNLGLAYMLDRKYPEALSAFEAAFELAPEHPSNWVNIADIYHLLGQEEIALEHYMKIIKKFSALEDITNTEIQLVLAQSYAHVGQAKLAINIIQSQLLENPGNPIVLYSASLIYSLLKERASAVHFAEKSLDQGMDPIWFIFPWFKPLCDNSSMFVDFKGGNQRTACDEI